MAITPSALFAARPRRLLLASGLAILVGSSPGRAQVGSGDTDPALVPGSEPAEMTVEEFGETLEAGRTAVARQVDSAAAYIDSFFGDERYEAELAENRLRVGASVLFEAAESPALDGDIDLRLVLPNTEERLRLFVGGTVRDDGATTTDDPELRDFARDNDERRNLSTDLRYVVLRDLEQHLDAILGLRISDMTPAVAFGLRYRRSWQPDDWVVRMTQAAEWETKNGFELKSFLDFETTPTEGYFFRATPEVVWQEGEDGIEYSLSYSVTQALGEDRLLQYVLGYGFVTEPQHELNSLLARARFRQGVFDDRVRFEIAPQLRLADRDGFDGTPGILFRVEVVF